MNISASAGAVVPRLRISNRFISNLKKISELKLFTIIWKTVFSRRQMFSGSESNIFERGKARQARSKSRLTLRLCRSLLFFDYLPSPAQLQPRQILFFMNPIKNNPQFSPTPREASTPSARAPLKEKVLTAAEQQSLTPDAVIESLKEGNQRYMNNDLTERDHSALVRDAVAGQYPKAVILSCLDSRVNVEDVFDRGIGDLFVARVAGNFVNEDMLGSMEFGCKVSGAKLILVLGHESCGAIKAAIDDVKLGNITAMLAKIKPAVEKSRDFVGEKTSANSAFVDCVAKQNIANTIENIRLKSPILNEMENNGEIKIVGAYYNLRTAEVMFL
jgi:carbonic anhydrase